MISAKSPIPIGQLRTERANQTRKRARGSIGRKRNKKEVRVVRIVSRVGAVEKRFVEKRFGRGRKGDRFEWDVGEDL